MEILMLMIALSSLALAQEPPPPPIVGGDTTTDFSPVGALLAVYGNNGFDFCSGTLAAKDWAVTAAHCIEAAVDYDRKGYDIYFCTGSNLYSNSGIDECDVAVDMISHPNYNSSSLSHDIGVVELSAGLRASGTYALNTSRPSTFSTSDIVTYVGWGITGDNRQDSGRKRTVEVPFLSHGGSIYYDGSFLYTWDPSGRKNICSGDSGGAGLMWDSGDWELIGVNSFGFDLNGGNPNCEGDYAAAGITRIDAHYDFLTTYIDVDDVDDDDDDNNNNKVNNNQTSRSLRGRVESRGQGESARR
jgi:secreted trypsin-like serine protease